VQHHPQHVVEFALGPLPHVFDSMSPTPELIALARAAASNHALDFSFSVSSISYTGAALVCAVVEQESAWDVHAIRYEPAFRTRYVAPLGLPPTEEIARSISWGLMQVMGQVAREHGYQGKFLSALCEPAAGLDIGCAVLAARLASARAHAAPSHLLDVIPNPAPRHLAGDGGEGSAFDSGAENQQQIPRTPSRAPAGAGEDPTARDSARDDSSPGIGFSVEAQGFSPAINDGPVVPTLLPQALAKAGPPGRRLVEPGASDAGPKRERVEGQGIALDENVVARALELWNGGANPDYIPQVLAGLPHYK